MAIQETKLRGPIHATQAKNIFIPPTHDVRKWHTFKRLTPHLWIDTLLLFSSIHQYLLISILTFISKQRPKLSEQSLPHQWRSIDNWNYSRSQKVQNSESKSERKQKWKWSHSPKSESGHFHQETHEGSTIKKFNWILQFSSPLAPPPLLLPCPKCLLTEAWKASSFGPLVLLLLHEGEAADFITTSEYWALWAGLLLQDVVDGDLLQEDLSTWLGTTW